MPIGVSSPTIAASQVVAAHKRATAGRRRPRDLPGGPRSSAAAVEAASLVSAREQAERAALFAAARAGDAAALATLAQRYRLVLLPGAGGRGETS